MIEMLLATMLVGMLTTLSILTFQAVTHGWQASTDYLDKVQRTDYALNQLIIALRSAYYPENTTSESSSKTDGKGSDPSKSRNTYGFYDPYDREGDRPSDSDIIEWTKKGSALIGSENAMADSVHRVRVMILEEGDNEDGDDDKFEKFRFRETIKKTGLYARAFVDPAFDGFQREYFPVTYVCNTEYDASMPNVLVAWPRIPVKNGLGEYLSSMGMTQLRIAETEKYAHVTFFFNGGVEKQYPGEDRVLVASPKVATYDLQPEMSAYEVCDKCVERIRSGEYDVVILNFANCDMVGHTGVLPAAIKAVETVDKCVGKVVDATLEMGGIAMITADHGNAEQMVQPDGSPMTAHTTNRVPFILCGAGTELRSDGRLADIAPTILDVMGLACPAEMDGKTLIVK